MHWVRREIANTLGLPEARVRCIAPDVGGGFGGKGHAYPEDLLVPFAARRLGFDRVPLLCAREIPVPGALPQVIRVLIHYYADDDHEAQHVYLGEARSLRSDLDAAQ